MTLVEQRREDKFDWKTKNMNEDPMVCRKRWVFTGDRARCRRTVGPHRTQDLETRVSLQRRGRDVRTTPRSSPDDLVISALYAVRYRTACVRMTPELCSWWCLVWQNVARTLAKLSQRNNKDSTIRCQLAMNAQTIRRIGIMVESLPLSAR